MSPILPRTYLQSELFILKLKFHWVSCVLSDNPISGKCEVYLPTHAIRKGAVPSHFSLYPTARHIAGAQKYLFNKINECGVLEEILPKDPV